MIHIMHSASIDDAIKLLQKHGIGDNVKISFKLDLEDVRQEGSVPSMRELLYRESLSVQEIHEGDVVTRVLTDDVATVFGVWKNSCAEFLVPTFHEILLHFNGVLTFTTVEFNTYVVEIPCFTVMFTDGIPMLTDRV